MAVRGGQWNLFETYKNTTLSESAVNISRTTRISVLFLSQVVIHLMSNMHVVGPGVLRCHYVLVTWSTAISIPFPLLMELWDLSVIIRLFQVKNGYRGEFILHIQCIYDYCIIFPCKSRACLWFFLNDCWKNNHTLLRDLGIVGWVSIWNSRIDITNKTCLCNVNNGGIKVTAQTLMFSCKW